MHCEDRFESSTASSECLGEEESNAVVDAHGADSGQSCLPEYEARVEGTETTFLDLKGKDRSDGGVDYVGPKGSQREEEVFPDETQHSRSYLVFILLIYRYQKNQNSDMESLQFA